jgi:hypothetical protein
MSQAKHWRHWAFPLGALAAVLVAAACQDAVSPAQPEEPFSMDFVPPPPPVLTCANFRLTGGGRTDKREHAGFSKNTPESHDFATFGFQARPDKNCPSEGAGEGQQEWNEHGTSIENAFGRPFAYHGRVTFFRATGEPQCGEYGGFGTLNFGKSEKYDNVPFRVAHACDVAEPGVGRDHIEILIGPRPGTSGPTYRRHGLLSGGNIQWHRLTGNN